MPEYLATCGTLQPVTVSSPNRGAARVLAITAFRQQDRQWWKRGLVELAPAIVHVCSCGKAYTLAQWRRLRLCGVQVFDDGQEPPRLETRHCRCRSTRGLEIDNHGNPWQAKLSRI